MLGKVQLGGKRMIVGLLHMIVIAPLLVYVGARGKRAPPSAFSMLIALGVLAAIYHGSAFFRAEASEGEKRLTYAPGTPGKHEQKAAG